MVFAPITEVIGVSEGMKVTMLDVATDSMTKGFDLIGIGAWIFPVSVSKDGTRKFPLTEHGHLDATNDVEQWATWILEEYSDRNPLVGVHMGLSGLLGADVDVKNGKNGWKSLDVNWFELTPTFSYPSFGGHGSHHIYEAPKGVRLAPAADYRGVSGLDIRAGSSWVLWTGDVPQSRDEFKPAPAWLCDESARTTGSAFEGGLDGWLNSLDDEPMSDKVSAVLADMPADMSHSDMVGRQMNLIRLHAEGRTGAKVALDRLRDAWLIRDPNSHSTPRVDWEYKFDEALASGVLKFGAEESKIANLPEYRSLTDMVPMEAIGEPNPHKKAYFDLIRQLVKSDMDDDSIASIVWNAPTVKAHSREFGITYLFDSIADARAKADVPDPEPMPTVEELPSHHSLLTPSEVALLRNHRTFVSDWVSYAERRIGRINKPYHESCAWDILANVFGFVGFVPMASRNHGVNLFKITLGGSSTGKTDSISLRSEFLNYFFSGDPGYDIGSDLSPQALQKALVERDGSPSFFNADEAADPLLQISDPKGFAAGMVDRLTKYFEGYVPPVFRTGDKDTSGKSAMTSFTMSMFGTLRRVFDALSRDQFESGFLVRVIWVFGDDIPESERTFTESQADIKRATTDTDPEMIALVDSLLAARVAIGDAHIPVLADNDALNRMAKNREKMTRIAQRHGNWDILEAGVARLGDTVRKVATLLALSDARTRVTLTDALSAISYAETWLASLIRASEMVSSSAFQREVSAIHQYLVSRGGYVSELELARRFKNLGRNGGEVREFQARMDSLVLQGIARYHEAGNGKGAHYTLIQSKGD